MRQSETLGDLAKALAAVQHDLAPAAFNAQNPFLRNRYADLGAIIAAAKPHLVSHGMSYSQQVYGDAGAIGVETIIMHSSGEWLSSSISLPMIDEKGKSAAQVAGSIITYLRRYALAAALGIYADEDTDGHLAQPSPQAQPEPQPEPPPRVQAWAAARRAHEGDDAAALAELTEFCAANDTTPQDASEDVWRAYLTHGGAR